MIMGKVASTTQLYMLQLSINVTVTKVNQNDNVFELFLHSSNQISDIGIDLEDNLSDDVSG